MSAKLSKPPVRRHLHPAVPTWHARVARKNWRRQLGLGSVRSRDRHLLRFEQSFSLRRPLDQKKGNRDWDRRPHPNGAVLLTTATDHRWRDVGNWLLGPSLPTRLSACMDRRRGDGLYCSRTVGQARDDS